MSMFLWAKCDSLKDSDDGCEEAPVSKFGRPFLLVCMDCINDEDDPAEAYTDAAHPLIRHDKPFSADQQALIDKWEEEAREDDPEA